MYIVYSMAINRKQWKPLPYTIPVQGITLILTNSNLLKPFIHTSQANWFKAARYCRLNGMHLASVNSIDEQVQLIKQIKEIG